MKREKIKRDHKVLFWDERKEKIKIDLTILFWDKKKKKLRVIVNIQKEISDVKKKHKYNLTS